MNPLSKLEFWLARGKTEPRDSDESQSDHQATKGGQTRGEQAPQTTALDEEHADVDAEDGDALIQASGYSAENSTPGMSGLELARDQEIRVLIMMNRTGWLVASDIARLIWPDTAYGRQMAYRLLKRLLKNEEILARPAPNCRMFALSQRGARRLHDETLEKARSGKNLTAGYFHHRRLANAFVIEKHLNPDGEWPYYRTEYEIQSDPSDTYKLGRKVPDVILLNDNVLGWVECENARKKKEDFDRLIEFTIDNLSRKVYPVEGRLLVEVIFVYEHEAAKTRIVNELVRRYKRDRHMDWYEFASSIVFTHIHFDRNRICTGLSSENFQNTLALIDHGITE